MRLALALPALVLFLLMAPAASAARDLPVGVRVSHDETVPGDDGCHSCTGVSVAVGFGVTECCDMPFFGIGASVGTGSPGGGTEARVYACYTAFVGICFVDETLHV